MLDEADIRPVPAMDNRLLDHLLRRALGDQMSLVEQQDAVGPQGGEVKVTIGYQACNVGTCLSPTTEEITIALGEVAPAAEVKAAKDEDAKGTPEEVAKSKNSFTAGFLKKMLK